MGTPSRLVYFKTLPIRIYSVANQREHWRTRWKRSYNERAVVAAMTNDLPDITLPCVVNLTRCAPRLLDDDNSICGFKATRDEFAKQIGVDDGDPRIVFRYEQRRTKTYAVMVEVLCV